MRTAAKESQLMTVNEVAASLRLSRSSVYRLIHAQILPAACRLGA
jgi:excisionase family DNA binding protein